MQATLVRGDERSEGPAAPMGLVQGASAGLIRRHWASVRRYLPVLGADDASADDLAQETFVLALHKGIEDRGAPTGAWLRRAARNLLRNDARKRRNVNLEDADQVWDERGDQGDARQQALRDADRQRDHRGIRDAGHERKPVASPPPAQREQRDRRPEHQRHEDERATLAPVAHEHAGGERRGRRHPK